MKFNDYFEFPRELDMSPYTAANLAQTEGTCMATVHTGSHCMKRCTFVHVHVHPPNLSALYT